MRYCLDARTATDHFPGIGRYVSNLARAVVDILEEGEQLIILRDPEKSSSWKLPTAKPGKTMLINSAISPFTLRQQRIIPRQLQSLRINVYHSPYYLMPYSVKLPTVVTIYDLIPQHYPQYVSLQARLLFRFTTMLALRAAKQILTISEATREELLSAYPLNPDRVTAIPLAPAPQFYARSLEEQARVRYKHELPDKYILYVGINKPHKNLIGLLDAWKILLHREGPTLPLLLIAGAWDPRYPEAKIQASRTGIKHAVRFVGPVEDIDLPGLFSGATAFVFPSKYEGFGLPVIEAMACGTPVACANTSSLPEVAGDAAILFDPNRPEDIANTVFTLLGDGSLRVNLKEKGLLQAKKFSWRRTAKSTLEIYRNLAKS